MKTLTGSGYHFKIRRTNDAESSDRKKKIVYDSYCLYCRKDLIHTKSEHDKIVKLYVNESRKKEEDKCQ
jgi:hypothetical protein